MKKKESTRILKTLFIAICFCLAWELLEKILYGEIQPRIVDDIVMVAVIPFIYKSVN